MSNKLVMSLSSVAPVAFFLLTLFLHSRVLREPKWAPFILMFFIHNVVFVLADRLTANTFPG